MYDVIRLENTNLQIPIVTKSSILDVGKVFHIRLCFTHTFKKRQQLSTKKRLVPNYGNIRNV